MSLRAGTIHAANSSFLPPISSDSQRSRSVPLSIPAAIESGPLSPSVLLKDTDPSQDDYTLWKLGKAGPQPISEEQAKFLSTPAKIPSLPAFTNNGKNIWAKGPQSAPSGRILRNYEVSAKNRNVSDQIYRSTGNHEGRTHFAQLDSGNDDPGEPNSGGDDFPKLTVNQIFEICCQRLSEKGTLEAGHPPLESGQNGDTDDKKSTASVSGSEACSEDLPFISSANVYSMKRRERRHALKKKGLLHLEDVEEQNPSLTPNKVSPFAENAEVGDISFASANSDPDRSQDDTPLFTIRSKKEPIKIVDPRTLQRPDKPKSPKDIAKDVVFLKRGLSVLGIGADLTREAYNMFKTVGMDNSILNQTSEWLVALQDFVKRYNVILGRADEALKKADLRNSFYENLGQMMLHKKKTDNSILGWINFGISMFPVKVDESPEEKKDSNESGSGSSNEKSPQTRIPHMHNNVCLGLTHELCKLTEGNRLKFKTMLTMMVDSLKECKDWLMQAPSYAKKPLKPLEMTSVPTLVVNQPAQPMKERKQVSVAEVKPTQIILEQRPKENEKPVAEVSAVAVADEYHEIVPQQDHILENPHYAYPGHQNMWYPQNYIPQQYAHQPQVRASLAEYIQPAAAAQIHRPRSAGGVQLPTDGYTYHQSQMHSGYAQEVMSKGGYRTQHAGSRGRQASQPGGHSRQQSTAGIRQMQSSQQYSGYPNSQSSGEYGYPQEPNDICYTYPQQLQQNSHQQPAAQHLQPWRNAHNVSPDPSMYEVTHSQYGRSTPEQIIGSGEFMRPDRVVGGPGAPIPGSHLPSRSMSVTPQMIQQSAILLQNHHHHAHISEHYAASGVSGGQPGYAQPPGPVAGYAYPHGTPGNIWPNQQHPHMQQSGQVPQQQHQQGQVQGRGIQKAQGGVPGMWPQGYPHHPGQFR
ncbi:hypothetical protein ABW19_dt0203338 [Dactylella cylindrospora]|nr:hypothetical protein ABW19_dt0203338 [Dactylella cylindrospora]